MPKPNILIIEDDENIQQLVSFNLIKAGFHASCATSGEEGLECLDKEQFDCVLLDLMLPGLGGLEVCEKIREKPKHATLPVIMLTAKREDNEIISGLESGADDYITKPFSPKVLVARIRATLRRNRQKKDIPPVPEGMISHQGLNINPGRHEVILHGQEIHLTITEFAILTLLARRPGWVYTRQQIIDTIRGDDYMVTPRMIDVQIFSLRKKMGEDGGNIETVRGIGYRFKDYIMRSRKLI